MISYNMKYKVEYTEVLQRTIEIEADSEAEALSIAEEKYYNEEVVLDYSDFIDCKIDIIK